MRSRDRRPSSASRRALLVARSRLALALVVGADRPGARGELAALAAYGMAHAGCPLHVVAGNRKGAIGPYEQDRISPKVDPTITLSSYEGRRR